MEVFTIKALVLLIIIITPALNWAANPHDEYYADDIFTAINEAKKRPHHYDYSSAKRYNRTTTQSLNIPKLLNREMGGTSIDSRDENKVSAEDISVNDQQKYQLNEDELSASQSFSISPTVPALGNPNVQSPSIKTVIRTH